MSCESDGVFYVQYGNNYLRARLFLGIVSAYPRFFMADYLITSNLQLKKFHHSHWFTARALKKRFTFIKYQNLEIKCSSFNFSRRFFTLLGTDHDYWGR